MKIIRLEAENVKRLRAIEIRPDPSAALVTIRGDNGQGKSSVLDAIAMALAGKSAQPPRVIREGETEAHVLVEFGDLLVERRWTSNDKSYLEVKQKDGAPKKSPQALLDGLIGNVTLDPLRFLSMEGKEQADAVRVAMGLDFRELDEKRGALYQERTVLGREVEKEKARLHALPMGNTSEMVDVAALVTERRGLELEAESHRAEQQEAADLERAAAKASADLEGQMARIANLELQVDGARTKAEAMKSTATQSRELAGVAKAHLGGGHQEAIAERLKKIDALMISAQEQNRLAALAQERKKLMIDIEQLNADVKGYTDQIKTIDNEKACLLREAPFPVPGLTFTVEGLLLNGLPFEQASQAERLRVSVAMGLAANPKLRVLLIRDGSLLDEKSMALLGEIAAGADAQVWIEIVGKGGTGVIIEDGTIAGAPIEPAPAPAKVGGGTAELLGFCDKCGTDAHEGACA